MLIIVKCKVQMAYSITVVYGDKQADHCWVFCK